jgi:6,7-dimethyl-8-ribityllumazine synthase
MRVRQFGLQMSREKLQRIALDGQNYRIAIIAARYNFEKVNELLESTLDALEACGVKEEDREVFRVPGANEIPPIAATVAQTSEFDAIIALAVVVAGETDHNEIITRSTASALQTVGINYDVPVINGILSVRTIEQADARISGDQARGPEFAQAAVETAQLIDSLQKRVVDNDLDSALDDLDWLDDLDDDDEDDDDWRK